MRSDTTESTKQLIEEFFTDAPQAVREYMTDERIAALAKLAAPGGSRGSARGQLPW